MPHVVTALQACTSKDDEDDEGTDLLGHILETESSPDVEQSSQRACLMSVDEVWWAACL